MVNTTQQTLLTQAVASAFEVFPPWVSLAWDAFGPVLFVAVGVAVLVRFVRACDQPQN